MPVPIPSATPSTDLVPLVASSVEFALPLIPCLLGAALFATLRVALQRSHGPRVLAATRSDEERARLEPLLAMADRLSSSAVVFEVTCRAAFVAMLYSGIDPEPGYLWLGLLWTIAIAVPCILVLCDALPTALALRRGDRILVHLLVPFHAFQLPLRWITAGFEAVRRALLRVVGLEGHRGASRQIVEGLRDVVEEAEIERDLDETEREIIGNVIEFRDVGVSAVMTPRTAIRGVEISETPLAAARKLSDAGHSRMPVYDQSLDTIVGIVTARDVAQAAANGQLESISLSGLLRPAHFVPDTKPVSELLSELRRAKMKMAIVLDEYGGTAGLVTLGDLIRELVGEIRDEFDSEERPPIKKLPDGSAEVDASLHVSVVNEELGLDIPEGDAYETLAGFILTELGHFPKRGEHVVHGAHELVVLEASDRRVLQVLVRRFVRERVGA